MRSAFLFWRPCLVPGWRTFIFRSCIAGAANCEIGSCVGWRSGRKSALSPEVCPLPSKVRNYHENRNSIRSAIEASGTEFSVMIAIIALIDPESECCKLACGYEGEPRHRSYTLFDSRLDAAGCSEVAERMRRALSERKYPAHQTFEAGSNCRARVQDRGEASSNANWPHAAITSCPRE